MKIKTLNEHTTPIFPADLREWEKHKSTLCETVRLASSIDLMRHDLPLDAKIFDTKKYDGFVVEKVIFRSLPGFYVTGNLYRPEDTSKKYPAVLNPHGHWKNGRLTVTELARIPQRCANLAMRGMVAFSYDMVGYCDSKQIKHKYFSKEWSKWNYGTFSVQLNNSVKAVDFVSSLPYVDSERIGCTGCSGGGTQTYFLSVIDERIKVAAPINMASTRMQGGCICENAPFLRTDYCNVDYTMAIAPRPLFMSASDGDWTVDSERVEFPAVERVYALYNASGNYEHFYQSAPHCYNKPTRERVYKFFCKHFGIEDKLKGEVDFEIDPETLKIGDIRKYVSDNDFVENGDQLFDNVKPIIEKNLKSLSVGEKAELKRKIYLLDRKFELDIPYWFDGWRYAPPIINIGKCPASAENCGPHYYYTYNFAEDAKRVSALVDLFRAYPDSLFRASGKTAALCRLASEFAPDVRLELDDINEKNVFIPGSELIK